MLRRQVQRQSFPPAASKTRGRRSQASATASSTSENDDPYDTEVQQARHIEGLETMLASQREELAEAARESQRQKAALESLTTSNREITVSTIAVEKLVGIPTFKTVESWILQFSNNKHLKVLENISPESRQEIDYEGNLRGLAVGEDWINLPESEILVLIKSCFPQKSEGEELSSTQYVEKMKSSVHLFFPGEKGSARFIHAAVNFCNLLPLEKINNITLQKEWIHSLWDKVPKNMKIKNALKEKVRDCSKLKEFIYVIGKYHYDIAQLNKPVEDNGFIVTADPKYGFYFNSNPNKRKDHNNNGEEKGSKDTKNDVSTTIPCISCGRTTPVRINGTSVVHSAATCFCTNHVDKNVTATPWIKSANGISFKSFGLNHLPHNKKLTGDRKSMIDYAMTPRESSGNH